MKRPQLLIAVVALSIVATSCSTMLHLLTTPVPSPVATTTVVTPVVVAPISTTNGTLTTTVLGCTRSGGSVTLELEMLNRGIDEIITINNGYIKIYDNVGNIYTKENSTIKVGVGVDTGRPFTTITYPQGVPLRYTIELSGVDLRASGIRSIEIGASSAGRISLKPSSPITLKNIVWINI